MTSINVVNPLYANPIYNNVVLGTSPTLIPTPSDYSKNRRMRIMNKSSLQNIAYGWVGQGATAPSITAPALGTGSSTDGFVIGPGGIEFLPLSPGKDLYLVASAANTPAAAGEVDDNKGAY